MDLNKTVVDIQRAENIAEIPTDDDIKAWVRPVVEHQKCPASISVRIVHEDEIKTLNSQYRNRPEATNVLSFPCDLKDESGLRLLGDIIVCAEIVNREAREQQKTPLHHWAHMIIHGLLHLFGYDHIEEHQAEAMEKLEVSLLHQVGIPDPYAESI